MALHADPLFLCGSPGCGKSTVGKALARAVGRTFVDTDALVVQQSGMPIDAIFAELGEPEFRARESAALIQAARTPAAIVALGGGTLVAAENRAVIAGAGRLVYLRASVALLERRLEVQLGQRPLLVGTSVGTLLERRRAFYESADVTVEVDGKPVRAIVAELKALL